MKKALVLFAVILLMAGNVFASAESTTDGTKYIKAAPFGELVFDDVIIQGSGDTTAWSNIYDISGYKWDQGSTNNKLYLSMFLAHANTSTTSHGDVTGTYQISLDGSNWITPLYVPTSGNPSPLTSSCQGLFATAAGDGCDPDDITASINAAGIYGWPAASTTGGAGPYATTLTCINMVEISPTKYIRFMLKNIEASNAVTVDFGFMKGNQ